MTPSTPRRREHTHPAPGAPPGTLTAHPGSSQPVIHMMSYDQDTLIDEEIHDLAVIAEHLGRRPVLWLNVDGLGDIDVIAQLGVMFGLHRLALEDVLQYHQRPKIEEYGEHLFFVLRMLEDGGPVATEQLTLFLGDGFVLTFQEHPGDCLDNVRRRIRESMGRIRTMGADYLAYCLVDAVVDYYSPKIDELAERAEDLETEVLFEPGRDTVLRIHEMKRDLLTMRRAVAPLREAVNALIRDEHPAVTDATRVYFRDCHDQVIQVVELAEVQRELVGGLLDVYLSNVSNRMNDVMKVLAVIATLFIPLTFLAGVYGMNFDPDVSPWNMPELRTYLGYPLVLLAMVLIVVFELILFRRKGWLGGPPATKKKNRNQRDGRPDT
ncbi:MAG: magnesium/cobalt transporter CorA [Candidatus Hydrogenedentes bacterium]|nr:magnesium/cobalt transporter CorA [Candidatus Hydrogenedentota bacterium]